MHARAVYTTMFAVLSAVLLALASLPAWRLGRTADGFGASFAYGHRRPAPSSADIVLVEIDDASIRELGPWPWSSAVLRKCFEAPFDSARAVLSAVSPGDFMFAEDAGRTCWKGLATLKATVSMHPFRPLQPSVDVIGAFGKHPAGGQGELLRMSDIDYQTLNTTLPEWRGEVIRSLANYHVRRFPAATLPGFMARILDPYWRKSVEVERLTGFWFGQALGAQAVESSAGLEGFDKSQFHGLPGTEYAYVPPGPLAHTSRVGVCGAAAGHSYRAPALYLFREKPFLRFGIFAAEATGKVQRPQLKGRRLTLPGSSEEAWDVELRPDGTLAANWTGSAERPWDEGFRRFSAATLVEAANSRRALWEGYRVYEASLGQKALPGLVEEYENAAAAIDYENMSRASRRIMGRISALQDSLGRERERLTARQGAASAAESKESKDATGFVNDVMALEFDQQVLRSSLLDAFDRKVVLIAPTASGFEKTRTPWGAQVPACALDVTLLNSILTGKTVREAGAAAWWAVALAGGVIATLVSARLGALKSLPIWAALAAALFYGWFRLFDARATLLGLSCLLPAAFGYLAGGASYYLTAGAQVRRARRILAGHVPPEFVRRTAKRYGRDVLREAADCGVLSVELVWSGNSPSEQATTDRYVRTVSSVIFGLDGIVVETTGDVEGAFGWLGSGEPFEKAVCAGLSIFNRLKLVAEKLEAEGKYPPALCMGAGAGAGVLAAGKVTKSVLVGRGESFDKARLAAAHAGRHCAGMVVTAADARKLSQTFELRRLDVNGDCYEVLERKGALPVTMGKVRAAYEKALAEIAGGRREEARLLLNDALSLLDDEPSRKLLEEISEVS